MLIVSLVEQRQTRTDVVICIIRVYEVRTNRYVIIFRTCSKHFIIMVCRSRHTLPAIIPRNRVVDIRQLFAHVCRLVIGERGVHERDVILSRLCVQSRTTICEQGVVNKHGAFACGNVYSRIIHAQRTVSQRKFTARTICACVNACTASAFVDKGETFYPHILVAIYVYGHQVCGRGTFMVPYHALVGEILLGILFQANTRASAFYRQAFRPFIIIHACRKRCSARKTLQGILTVSYINRSVAMFFTRMRSSHDGATEV